MLGVRKGEAIYTVVYMVYIASPFLTPHSLLPAFEDGTDTWFRNVAKLRTDAGEIPKRTYTVFKSRRKLKIYNMSYDPKSK